MWSHNSLRMNILTESQSEQSLPKACDTRSIFFIFFKCIHVSPPSLVSLHPTHPIPSLLVITERRAELPVLNSGSYCVQVKVLVDQLCQTLWDATHDSPPGFSVIGILQAGTLESVAIPSYRGSSRPRDWTQVSRTAGRFFTNWVTGN